MKRALGMAPVLSGIGCDVTILMLDHAENRAAAMLLRGVKCVFFPRCGVFAERTWKSVYLSSNEFDVVIYNSLGWRNAVLRGGKSRDAFAWMEHCELESANKNISSLRRLSLNLLERWSLFAFEGHICASRYLLDLMKRRSFSWGISRHIIWSPYAIDASVVQSTRTDEKRPIALGRKLILHLGTVAKNYGCLFLIDGLKLLSAQRSDWRAQFIGKGQDLGEARKRVVELGLQHYVEFPGYVDEVQMRRVLAESSVFLSHLNDTEQDWARCPSKLYYYMAMQRPIVTSLVGENRIALGDDGFYYTHDDPGDLAHALNTALNVGPDWRPSYDVESVTWERRTDEFLREVSRILK